MHRLLKRQLKRHPVAAGEDSSPLRSLLDAVDAAYHQYDDDLEMLGRSLDLSSQELMQANASLRALLDEQEARVRQRTAELDDANQRLRGEIAEREVVERRLRESEERLQEAAETSGEALRKTRHILDGILESMPSAIIGLDNRSRVTHWNEGAARVTGVGTAEALGRPLREVFGWLASWMRNMAGSIEAGTPLTFARQPYSNKDRTSVLDVMICPILGRGVEGTVVRLDDVTERTHLEEIMVQTEKMMTVGSLAAGMAHEINNPLGGILQSAQVVMARLGSDAPANREAAARAGFSLESLRSFMEERDIPSLLAGIRESATRATQIVNHMLEFSRKSESRRKPCDARQLMDRAVTLAASDYDLKKLYDFKKISVAREYDIDLPNIPCSATQIEQVLVNLLRNAAQALAEAKGGEPPRIVLRARREERFVRIEVEDNGPGMSREVRRRAFEPFFTTKPPGLGTGLGLSVSYFIISQHHSGAIEAESDPGKGTRFIIRLPLE